MGPSHQVAQTPSGGDDVAHWRDEKTEAQHGEATPGSPGFLESPRPQSSPTRPASLPSQPFLHSCLSTHPGAPFTQRRAPPSLPLLLIYVPTGLGCPPPGSSSLGLSTLCGSSHRHPGSLRTHSPCTQNTLQNPQTTSQNHICFAHKPAPRPDRLVSALPGIPSAGTTCQPPRHGQAPRLQLPPGPGPPHSPQEGARAGAGARAGRGCSPCPR